MLVYENYSKFISATYTIKRMNNNIVGMEANMEQLLEKITSVQSRTDGVNTSLFEKREHIEKLHRTRNLLCKVQVGADVPAESFVMSPVDCVFVRTILWQDKKLHLCCESVLEHLVNKVYCRGMFSAHYHRLAIGYEKDPKVSLCHTACQVGEGIEGLEDVTFLCRLTPGACPKSYGVNVARLAGLPDIVLQKATSKSQEFEDTYGRKTGFKYLLSTHQKEELKNMMKNIMNIVANWSCHESVVSTLVELQHKAGLLLEQN